MNLQINKVLIKYFLNLIILNFHNFQSPKKITKL